MTGREKIVNASLAVVMLTVSIAAFRKYAPVPQARRKAEPSTGRVQKPSVSPSPSGVSPQLGQPASMMNLLGRELARGHEAVSATEYVGQLEMNYLTRGYQDFSALKKLKKVKKSAAPSKLYWRSKADNVEMICALGNDADPRNAQPSSTAQMYITVATGDANGGANWATYQHSQDAARWDSEEDFPGEDPRHVPRPNGVRRLFSLNQDASSNSSVAAYSSSREPGELADWYRRNMSASWQYDELATSGAGELADGVICFSRADKFCLIWLSHETPDRSLIIVSVNQK